MAQTDNNQADGHIGGVSLASFLQMLEQEKKTCVLHVSAEGQEGSFYFEEGELVDAECAQQAGLDAAYALLALNSPRFRVDPSEDRIHRITLPLAHILLNAATRVDEAHEQESLAPKRVSQAGIVSTEANPALKKLIETIVDTAGVKHYYLLNRQGKMITQSSKNQHIGDFITYCIISGIQIRKSLGARGPQSVRLVMENNDILLILPGAGMIIGLLLDEHASISDVTARLRPALAHK